MRVLIGGCRRSQRIRGGAWQGRQGVGSGDMVRTACWESSTGTRKSKRDLKISVACGDHAFGRQIVARTGVEDFLKGYPYPPQANGYGSHREGFRPVKKWLAEPGSAQRTFHTSELDSGEPLQPNDT